MSARDAITPEQRAVLAGLLGASCPAQASLLLRLGEAVQDCRKHEHGSGEDLLCGNLYGWLGERMAPVLRRLLDAESEAARYRIAWRIARTRARSLAVAADRSGARVSELQTGLQDAVFAVVGMQMERGAARAEVLREAAEVVGNDDDPTGGEYRYCGASLGRTDYPYTCERRVGHDGPCGPDRDDAGGTTTQPADTTPLIIHWDRLVMGPSHSADDEITLVACRTEDGRPAALMLDDEHRQDLGEQLLTPLGDDARGLLAEIRRRGGAITSGQAHRWLGTHSTTPVPRAYARNLLIDLAENGDLVVREQHGRRTYALNHGGGPTRVRRTQINHKKVAAKARRSPGKWRLAGTYRSRNTAQGMVYAIRSGRYAPYAPAGVFEARVRNVGDEAGLDIRFVGGESR